MVRWAGVLGVVGVVSLAWVPASAAGQGDRPVGVAFGGGSARGIAHVGVIRWLDEHHIPIDVAAGTSMGGLIGGAFATGMDADEIQTMLQDIDWNQMFGFSSFPFKNVRRKEDARAYPSRLEFGLKGGISAPVALNSGQQVDLLITRITAPYFGEPDFSHLPTSFKVVATDLKSAQPIVLDRGSLARAMRATMALPGIFPPVELDGRVLVDGGAMDNVPADVVRAMGAKVVIAVNVGDLSDQETIRYSILGLAGATLDAMMRANTRKALPSADVVIDVPLKDYGSLDWRRSDELITEGYKAAEAMSAALLPYQVDEASWQAWVAAREARRKRTLPDPQFISVAGITPSDERRLAELLGKHVGRPLDVPLLEHDLEELTGLDRYETIYWELERNAAGDTGLVVHALPKPQAPPFLMIGLNLENTTSDEFRISLGARYLQFDLLGSGSELRVDGTFGADLGLGLDVYEPVWRATFARAFAGLQNRTYNLIADNQTFARYAKDTTFGGLALGVNLGRASDVSAGLTISRLDAHAEIGDPSLPAAAGRDTRLTLRWRIDTQDSPSVPSEGLNAGVEARHVLHGPDLTYEGGVPPERVNSTGLLQLDGRATQFWSPGEKNRLFALVAGGASFNEKPMPLDQFELGGPLQLGSLPTAAVTGDYFGLVTTGYLREVGRLPDFFGGSMFAGGWLELGDAWDSWDEATLRTSVSGAVVLDTMLGPLLTGGSFDFDGNWRWYFGLGRLFR